MSVRHRAILQGLYLFAAIAGACAGFAWVFSSMDNWSTVSTPGVVIVNMFILFALLGAVFGIVCWFVIIRLFRLQGRRGTEP
jgi:hypothetical protein